MQDAFNLGWKLAAVLHGRCPASLLHTYSAVRWPIAKEVIDFDREFAALLASQHDEGGPDPATFQNYFIKHGRYTAGTAAHYGPSLLIGESAHQHLAKGFVVGERFHSAPVIRMADAKPVHLGHVGKADGRFRIYIFAGSGRSRRDRTRNFASFAISSPTVSQSPVRKYTRQKENVEDIDAVIDVRAMFQQPHRDLAIEAMPALLLPRKGRYGLQDYEKIFCADIKSGQKSGQDIFDMRGIDRRRAAWSWCGRIRYIAQVLPSTEVQLAKYFDGFMLRR